MTRSIQDISRPCSAPPFLSRIFLGGVLVLAMLWALSMTAGSQEIVVDQKTFRIFDQAMRVWRVCPSSGCQQSRIEVLTGVPVIWI